MRTLSRILAYVFVNRTFTQFDIILYAGWFYMQGSWSLWFSLTILLVLILVSSIIADSIAVLLRWMGFRAQR